MMASSRGVRLRAFVLPVLATLGCDVYDPALLNRRDASTDAARDVPTDRGTTSDLATDQPPADDLGTPAGDVTVDVTTMDVRDAGADATVDVSSDLGRDVVVGDTGADAGQSCTTTLAMGSPCIEPVTGHRWNPDDRRLIAPGAMVLASDRLYVSDPASSRVMSYDLSTAMLPPTRVLGTGVAGISLTGGVARSTPVLGITSMVNPEGSTFLFGDTEAHQVLRLRDGQISPVPLALSFPVGPFGMAYASDTRELFIVGDNRLHVVSLDNDGGFGTPTTVVGQMCGGSCVGFNGDGMPGTMTALANPVSVDVSPTYVYFSDRDNCRIRRFRRDDVAHTVETFAGSTCDLTGDLLAGSSDGFPTRTMLRLGRVTDVRFGSEGSVYLVDASHCAVVQVVGPTLSVARVVLGSRFGCNQPVLAGEPIGRIGGLAMSTDRSSFYVSDQRLQRVLRVANTGGGGSPTVTVSQTFGPTPAPDEDASLLRVGRPSALTVINDGTLMLVGGQAEGRLYSVEANRTRVVLGAGTASPVATADPVTAATLPTTWVAGLGGDGTRAVLGMPERGVIADLSGFVTGATMRRIAGRYTAEAADAGVVRDAGADARVTATETTFQRPGWPFVQGARTWFSDAAGRVWRVDTAGDAGVAEIVAGSGAATPTGVLDGGTIAAGAAPLGSPVAFALDGAGTLYIADAQRYVVWGVSAAGEARVVAGVLDQRSPLGDDASPATTRGIAQPVALAYDGTDTLYVADAAANRVRAITLSTGRMATVAGSGATTTTAPTSSGDYGPARSAQLAQPTALAWVRGRLYVAEGASGRVRAIVLP